MKAVNQGSFCFTAFQSKVVKEGCLAFIACVKLKLLNIRLNYRFTSSTHG